MNECRICLNSENQPLISPCKCSGTSSYVHIDCLHKSIVSRNISPPYSCEICLTEYTDPQIVIHNTPKTMIINLFKSIRLFIIIHIWRLIVVFNALTFIIVLKTTENIIIKELSQTQYIELITIVALQIKLIILYCVQTNILTRQYTKKIRVLPVLEIIMCSFDIFLIFLDKLYLIDMIFIFVGTILLVILSLNVLIIIRLSYTSVN